MAPVLLLALLVAGEAGMLLSAKSAQDRATATVAEYAASRPGDESWHAVANRELGPDCDVTVDEPLPGILEASATCTYTGRLVSGFTVPVSSRESAAERPGPTPTPTPEPSPSESVTP